MTIIRDCGEFRIRTGIFFDFEFEPIDIIPDTPLGFFQRPRLHELKAFCQRNPQYHIVSFLQHAPIKVNTIVENAAFYALGNGDSNPDLIYVADLDAEEIIELLVLKFDAR